LIRIGQVTIGIDTVLLLFFSQTYINLFGLIFIGLGCAPIYPSMLHETPVRFGKSNSSKLMGIQMASAYVGTTLVPPTLGVIMGKFGVNLYPVFILLLVIIMFISCEKTNKVVSRRNENVK
jgi:fucose permease